MRSLLSAYTSFLIGILIYSCSSYVSVQKTLPPEIVLKEDSANFLFVNRFKPDDLDYNNENKVEVFEMGVENYIKGLQSGFDTCSHHNLIMSDTTIPSHSAHEPAYNLSQSIIQDLHDKYKVDYIFSLDNYDLYFDQEVVVHEEEDGSKSKTAYYDLVLNTFITIYAIDGSAMDKMKEEMRILHDTRSVVSGLLAVGPSMGKADENVIKISNELGSAFVKKFYKVKVKERRVFYTTKEFKTAFKAYQRGDWDTAERELTLLTNHPEEKIQGRAAYNLAVVFENLGKDEEMAYWYRRAEEKLGSLPKDPLQKIITPF